MAPPALSRISEDSRTSHRKYVNIAGIEEYPDLVGESHHLVENIRGGISYRFRVIVVVRIFPAVVV